VGMSADDDETIGDVRNLEDLCAAVDRARPEVVFHLAAQPLVQESVRDPVTTYGTNVMGTVHLLEAVRRTPSVAAVVVVTSDKCYENDGRSEPYGEGEAMGGHDPYSSSKGAAELVAAAYRRTYFSTGPPVATARAGNVIGGGDWSKDRLIPDLVRALAADRDPRLRFPGAVRPWQHVLDALNGYLMLADRLLADGTPFAGAWNFGPSESSGCTVAAIAEMFLASWGSAHRCIIESTVAPNEAPSLRLDSSRARMLLGWSPHLDIAPAIDTTARWYRAWLGGADMRVFTLTDVAQFA
jgi:CDP-glucose 4,6-dehydratase